MPIAYEKKPQNINFSMRTILKCNKHLHNHVEMCIIINGSTEAYADGTGGLVSKGDSFISFPNQVHSFQNDSEDLICMLFIFPPDIISSFSNIFKNKKPKNPITHIDLNEISQLIDIVTSEISNDNEFSKSKIEGCLEIMLSIIFENTDFCETQVQNLNTIKSILNFCSENYNTDITLEMVAENVHVNRFYVSHVFNNEIGISFPDFINSLRVEHATDLISYSNMSITEIAFTVGFNSLRSFNRSFLAQTGKTPREYKKFTFSKK